MFALIYFVYKYMLSVYFNIYFPNIYVIAFILKNNFAQKKHTDIR